MHTIKILEEITVKFQINQTIPDDPTLDIEIDIPEDDDDEALLKLMEDIMGHEHPFHEKNMHQFHYHFNCGKDGFLTLDPNDDEVFLHVNTTTMPPDYEIVDLSKYNPEQRYQLIHFFTILANLVYQDMINSDTSDNVHPILHKELSIYLFRYLLDREVVREFVLSCKDHHKAHFSIINDKVDDELI